MKENTIRMLYFWEWRYIYPSHGSFVKMSSCCSLYIPAINTMSGLVVVCFSPSWSCWFIKTYFQRNLIKIHLTGIASSLPAPHACCLLLRSFLYTRIINVWLIWLYWQQGHATQRNCLHIDCSPETDSRIRVDGLAYFFSIPRVNSQVSVQPGAEPSRKWEGRIKRDQVITNNAEGWPTVEAMQIRFQQRTECNYFTTILTPKKTKKHKQANRPGWSSLIFMSHYILGNYCKWKTTD